MLNRHVVQSQEISLPPTKSNGTLPGHTPDVMYRFRFDPTSVAVVGVVGVQVIRQRSSLVHWRVSQVRRVVAGCLIEPDFVAGLGVCCEGGQNLPVEQVLVFPTKTVVLLSEMLLCNLIEQISWDGFSGGSERDKTPSLKWHLCCGQNLVRTHQLMVGADPVP